MANKIDIKKLRSLYNEVKNELETVYITSSGDKYIKEIDALFAEAQIQKAKGLKKEWENLIEQQKWRNIKMGIIEAVLNALKEENWGLYYKNEPIRSLNTQEGGMLYEINNVDQDEIERVLANKLKSTQDKGENWKEHTTHHSLQGEDLKQNKN